MAVRQLQHPSPQVARIFGDLVGSSDLMARVLADGLAFCWGGFVTAQAPQKNHARVLMWEEGKAPQKLKSGYFLLLKTLWPHNGRSLLRQVRRSALSVVGQVGIKSNSLVRCSIIMSGGGPWWYCL